MSTRTLGFDWKIQLRWMDHTAARVAAGISPSELRQHLDRYLQDDHEVELSPTARSKAITVLSHLWCEVPEDAKPLRARSVRVLGDVLPEERIGIHWAMCLGTYPFFGDVAAATGTLLSLQHEVELKSVRRRVAEKWGERSTVRRAVGIVLGTMRDWGVLEETGKGRSRPTGKLALPADVSSLIVEGLLLSFRLSSMPTTDARNHPAVFPFELQVDSSDLRRTDSLRVDRMGGGGDIVALAGS